MKKISLILILLGFIGCKELKAQLQDVLQNLVNEAKKERIAIGSNHTVFWKEKKPLFKKAFNSFVQNQSDLIIRAVKTEKAFFYGDYEEIVRTFSFITKTEFDAEKKKAEEERLAKIREQNRLREEKKKKEEAAALAEYIRQEEIKKQIDNKEYTGKFRYVYSNGDVYDGDFVKGVRSGHGKYTWRDGSWYNGSIWNNMKHGWGTYRSTSGHQYEGNWKNDNREGVFTVRKWLWAGIAGDTYRAKVTYKNDIEITRVVEVDVSQYEPAPSHNEKKPTLCYENVENTSEKGNYCNKDYIIQRVNCANGKTKHFFYWSKEGVNCIFDGSNGYYEYKPFDPFGNDPLDKDREKALKKLCDCD